jgi:hypothetical protein
MLFKELQLVKGGLIDKDALLKHIESDSKSQEWKFVLKTATEKCYKDLANAKDEILSAFEKPPNNFKKDECNVTLFAVGYCIRLQGFQV